MTTQLLEIFTDAAHRARRGIAWTMPTALAALAALVSLSCTSVTRPKSALVAEQTFHVDPAGNGDFTTIAQALAEAEAGATIDVAPGTYREQLVLDKGVRLIGSGWEQTRILGTAPPAKPTEEQLEMFRKRYELARTDQQRKAIQKEIQKSGTIRPLIDVRMPDSDRSPVHIEGFKFTLEGEVEAGTLRAGCVVRLGSGKTTITDCVLAGSPANGIQVEGRAQVTVENSLICGVWHTGIRITQTGDDPLPVTVRDVELRNCRYAGLGIGGAKNVRVEGCRISGASWHGIRYDAGSPEIVGNLIFDNQRSGIYASGKTSAVLKDNLFLGNGSTHWFESEDIILHNTFVGPEERTFSTSSQAGVAVLGKSMPIVRNNVFYAQKAAIFVGDIGGDIDDDISAENIESTGSVEARDNLFWKNEHAIAKFALSAQDPMAYEDIAFVAEDGNEIAAPGFADVAKGDFSWHPDARARSKPAGARRTFPRKSRWARQPEEDGISDQRTQEQDRTPGRNRTAKTNAASEIAKPWIEDVMQVRDAEKRARAVETIRTALESSDLTMIYAGLLALTQTLEANYDKAQFADLARDLTQSTDGSARVKAFYALHNTGRESADLDLLLGALERSPDPPLQSSGTHLLMLYSEGKLEGRTGEVALKLLKQDGEDTRQSLSGLFGAQVSPEIETFLIELADNDRSMRHDAIYFGLSTLENKSPAVLGRLFKACQSSDLNDSGRALWGLGHGVPPENHAMVADFCLQLFEARSSGQTRKRCLDYMARYGNTNHVDALHTIAENDLVPKGLRKAATTAITQIQTR